MINKMLMIDVEKCTGCRICELACSFEKDRECNPSKSRIHILKWEEAGLDVPMVCVQCDEAPCKAVCPVRAIREDEETGILVVDENLCIGCKMCVLACPFGGLTVTPDRKIVKCDLCEGDPACVKYCPTEAIDYVPITRATLMKKRASAEKIGELVRKLVAVG